MHPFKNFRSPAGVIFLLMLWLGFSQSIHARIPAFGSFIPDPPVAGEPIIFRQDFPLGCPPVHVPNVDGESDWLLVEGNDIHLFIVFRQGVPCGVPPPGPTVDFDFGILPAGDYTLFQYQVPTSVTFPANPNNFVPVSETNFTVVAGARSIPSLNVLGLGLLVILLAGVAGWRFFLLDPWDKWHSSRAGRFG